MKTLYNIDRIEEEMKSVYQSVQPGEAFKMNLRAEILERTAAGASSRNGQNRWRLSLGMRFAFGISLALIVLVIVFALDTESLLAQARAFFRFIPGIGFVENSNARTLCSPVEKQEGDLNVKILAAGGSGRNLHFSFTATYPTGERQIGYALYDDAENKAEMRGGGGGGGGGDGGPITMHGSGDFLLSSDSNSMILVLNQGLPDGGSLGEVRLPFELCPVPEGQAGQEPAGQNSSPGGTQQAAELDYSPQDAMESQNGIAIQVVQVSQSAQGTGIQLHAALDPKADLTADLGKGKIWVSPFGMRERNLSLTDDTGREYALQNVPLMNDLKNPGLSSHQFDPLGNNARRLTLTVQEVSVLLEDQPVPFTFDPGGKARLGQVWEGNQISDHTYNLNGFELTFLEAKYSQSRQQIDAEKFADMYTLTFKVKVVPPGPKMTLACARINFIDATTECSWSQEEEAMILKTSFLEDIGERVLVGNLDSVNVSVEGPWLLSWDAPR